MKKTDVEQEVNGVWERHYNHITHGTPEYFINKAAKADLIAGLSKFADDAEEAPAPKKTNSKTAS